MACLYSGTVRDDFLNSRKDPMVLWLTLDERQCVCARFIGSELSPLPESRNHFVVATMCQNWDPGCGCNNVSELHGFWLDLLSSNEDIY